MLVYQLPFGSFVPGQPDATVNFDAELNKSDGATVGTPLNLSAVGFFALGADPLDNPGSDPPIIGAAATGTITPTVLELVKQSDASEGERSSGPNYPITFTLTLDLASGETVDNLVVEDFLPNSYVYVANSLSVTTSGGFSSTVPIAGSPITHRATGCRSIWEASPGTGAVEAVITYQAWISEFDADGKAVLNGREIPAVNNAHIVGQYQSLPIFRQRCGDRRDGFAAIHFDPKVGLHSGIISIPGTTPGDTLEYVMNLQVSDFFEFSELLVNDTFSDGQLWDASFSPTFVIREEGSITSGTFSGTQHTVTNNVPGDGTTEVQFNLSSVIGDGILTGDLYNDAILEGTTTVQIRFRTIIQEDFDTDFPSGDRSVDTGDPLTNTVSITGRVMDGDSNSQFESDSQRNDDFDRGSVG